MKLLLLLTLCSASICDCALSAEKVKLGVKNRSYVYSVQGEVAVKRFATTKRSTLELASKQLLLRDCFPAIKESVTLAVDGADSRSNVIEREPEAHVLMPVKITIM